MVGNGDDLTRAIVELLEAQQDMYEPGSPPSGIPPSGMPTVTAGPSVGGGGGFEDRVRKYLQKVQSAAQTLGCTGYTITAGFPWGISASLSFQIPSGKYEVEVN